ncbi:MAG: lysine exporter LysO family protein [Bacteroidota bacterium]
MRGSFMILGFFIVGILVGQFNHFPVWVSPDRYSTWVLYLLMFLIGVGVGADKKAMRTLTTFDLKIFMVPVSTIIGTLLGVSLIGLVVKEISLTELMAVGAGFGYYSLSSVIITELHSAGLGVIALLSNVMREIITLLFAPLLVKAFGKLAPVSSGGATSMDTTLPIINITSGKEFALIAFFHGILLSILVPFLVTFLLSL